MAVERQQFREELRLQAAERFARGETSSVTAEDLRVSVRPLRRWRQMWDAGGPRALRSGTVKRSARCHGPGGADADRFGRRHRGG
ncbi:helix-turn-helix domain-containing protein [Streptomyces sp. NPDC048389]|uniref:helix-turn-helix domain-containing protein n=1 Tax=Streptomyces sp. NPDC048389 TaxID=3154622 RepID=UPI0034573258